MVNESLMVVCFGACRHGPPRDRQGRGGDGGRGQDAETDAAEWLPRPHHPAGAGKLSITVALQGFCIAIGR